jgi:hypothetical protein
LGCCLGFVPQAKPIKLSPSGAFWLGFIAFGLGWEDQEKLNFSVLKPNEKTRLAFFNGVSTSSQL